MISNFLLTEREGRTGKYWLEVERSEVCIKRDGVEQVRLISCLLYGIVSLRDRALLVFVNVRDLRLPSANFER